MGRKITQFWANLETFGRVIADPMCGFRVYPIELAIGKKVLLGGVNLKSRRRGAHILVRAEIFAGRRIDQLQANVAPEHIFRINGPDEVAISRIYLDNFENVQSSWVTQGLKTCQLGLRFGGNDVGSIMIGENVASHHRATEEELRRLIRDAGFIPKQRDTLYATYFLN